MKKAFGFFHDKTSLFLLFILLVSAFLRLYKIGDYITFLGDEGRDVLVAYNILHGHLTLLGPTASVGGFFLGPIYYYFIAPFLLLFNYSPVGPAVFVGLVGVATVWLVYKIGSEFFGKTAALISAGLYAISPLVLMYSRSSWNPNVVPFFALLTMYSACKAVQRKSLKLFLLTGMLFGILMQLHYLCLFIGVILFVYIFICEFFLSKSLKTVQKLTFLVKQYIIVFAGFLITFSPFLLFEVRHDFLNIKMIFAFIFHSKDTGASVNFLGTIADVFSRLFGRLLLNLAIPEDLYMKMTQQVVIYLVVGVLVGVICLGFFIRQYISFLKTKKEKGFTALFAQKTLILLWIIIGIILFGFYKKNIYDYYFTFLFPLPFFLLGNFFSFLWEKGIAARCAVGACLIGIIALNISGNVLWQAPNRQVDQAERIAKFVNDQTHGQPYNFALLSGNNSDFAYRYFLTLWNHPPVTIQNSVVDPSRSTVTKQLMVICEYPNCKPLGNSLWEIAGFGRADIANHWYVSIVEVYKLVPYKGK